MWFINQVKHKKMVTMSGFGKGMSVKVNDGCGVYRGGCVYAVFCVVFVDLGV